MQRVNVAFRPGAEYIVKTIPSGLSIYYDGTLLSAGDRFIALADKKYVEVSGIIAGSVSLQFIELLRNFYDIFDQQGGAIAYSPELDRWTTFYSFRPDQFDIAGNRLVTFFNGRLFVHDGSNNNFYGEVHDSYIAVAHNEGGSAPKVYQSIAIEGSEPDIMHTRTESPFEQSSDVRKGEFDIKEGVNYASILRDRLSPNVTGSVNDKLMKGDVIRGEIGKFQAAFIQPTLQIVAKFVTITFTPSRGHKV